MLQVPKERNASRTEPARSSSRATRAATANGVALGQERDDLIGGRAALGGVDGHEHVEEAVLLEAGRGVGVAHGVVQAGGGLERHPRRHAGDHGGGELVLVGVEVGAHAAGAQLGVVTRTDERGEQRGPAFVTRQLDVHLETRVTRDRGVQGRHHLRGIDPGRDGDLEGDDPDLRHARGGCQGGREPARLGHGHRDLERPVLGPGEERSERVHVDRGHDERAHQCAVPARQVRDVGRHRVGEGQVAGREEGGVVTEPAEEPVEQRLTRRGRGHDPSCPSRRPPLQE